MQIVKDDVTFVDVELGKVFEEDYNVLLCDNVNGDNCPFVFICLYMQWLSTVFGGFCAKPRW